MSVAISSALWTAKYKAYLAQINAKLGQSPSYRERVEIAIEITRTLRALVHAETEALKALIPHRVISATIGKDWYIALLQDQWGRSVGYNLIHIDQIRELGSDPELEPFIWLVEALNGRN